MKHTEQWIWLPKNKYGNEPGMKMLTLSPTLLGLEAAKAELLTPFGKVICKMEKGKEPIITYTIMFVCIFLFLFLFILSSFCIFTLNLLYYIFYHFFVLYLQFEKIVPFFYASFL